MSFHGVDYFGIADLLTEEERLVQASIRRFVDEELLPVDAVTTSPGLTAVPDGMLVVAPKTPTTLTGSARRAIASSDGFFVPPTRTTSTGITAGSVQ